MWLMRSHHRFRQWHDAEQVIRHHPKQQWPRSQRKNVMCCIRERWVNPSGLSDSYMCQKTRPLLVKIVAATCPAAKQLSETKVAYLGLGLQGLYSATNCVDNIISRFTIILHNQIARLDALTNFAKRWVVRFRLNASISSHKLICFGKQFHARGPHTANACLPKVSCLNFGTFRTRSSLDLMEYLLLFDGMIISWM